MVPKDVKLEQLIDAFEGFWRTFRKQSDLSSSSFMPTFFQFRYLRFIQIHSGITLSKFANDFGMSKSSATQFIIRLIGLNLVKKKEDTKDKRIVHVYITKEGEKEIGRFREQKRERMKKMLSKIAESDLNDLLRIHKKLLKNIGGDNK